MLLNCFGFEFNTKWEVILQNDKQKLVRYTYR